MSNDIPDPNHRILVIDDMPDIHRAFRKLLAPAERAARMAQLEASLFGTGDRPRNDLSFEVDCALQGEEGLAMVRGALATGRPYAMAFIDMRMPPGWDGLQTIEAIWRDYADLEVVICTAYSDYSDDEIVSRLGATDQLLLLRKPFDAIEVRQLARALTGKWALRQQARLRTAELERSVASRTRELSAMNERLAAELLPRSATIDLNQAVAEAVELMRETIRASAELDTDFAPLPPVPCSSADLNPVLVGLLDNAVQAIEVGKRSGPGRISVSTRSDGDCAVISISDSGEAVADRDRIFQPFFVAREGERQGLGAARRVIVEHCGGELRFDDSPGGGSTLVVRLPLTHPRELK